MALRADDVDLERDRALVQRFQAGDDYAFDELYRRYHDRLERFCRKRVGDQDTAEEVTQEAFTRALTALPALRGELKFYPWVSVIAARLCVDSHRRQSRSEPAADPDPGPVNGGQEDIVDAVDSSLVVTALARLAPRHQDVLHLREVQGWSYQRIADHYEVKVGTVETLLFRARRALRREFHIVDGAGLAALPVLGRMLEWAARARNRMPPWVPSPPTPGTMAAMAAATAATVALAVAPSGTPHKVVAAPPSHATPARTNPVNGTVGRAIVTALVPAAAPAVAFTPTASTLAAPTTSSSAGSGSPAAPSTDMPAATRHAAPATAASGGTPTTSANTSNEPSSTILPPVTVPPIDAVTDAALSVPSSLVPSVVPAVTGTVGTVAGSLAAAVQDAIQDVVQHTVGNVLPVVPKP